MIVVIVFISIHSIILCLNLLCGCELLLNLMVFSLFLHVFACLMNINLSTLSKCYPDVTHNLDFSS